MKRTSVIALIICLLLTSCQLGNPKLPENAATSAVSATKTAATVSTQEQMSSLITDITAVTGEGVTVQTITGNGVTLVTATNPSGSASQPATPSATAPQQTTARPNPTQTPTNAPTAAPTNPPASASTEMRAIWISCYDYTSAAGKTRAQYKAITDTMFANIKNCGLNTAFVHLRAFSDAFYKSDIYPY